MIVKIDRSFEKDTDKIKNKNILQKIAVCIEEIQNANTFNEISNLKKMKGAKYHFRIRIGEYRVGLVISNNTAFFERFLHRKDIYKKFP